MHFKVITIQCLARGGEKCILPAKTIFQLPHSIDGRPYVLYIEATRRTCVYIDPKMKMCLLYQLHSHQSLKSHQVKQSPVVAVALLKILWFSTLSCCLLYLAVLEIGWILVLVDQVAIPISNILAISIPTPSQRSVEIRLGHYSEYLCCARWCSRCQ